MVACKPVLNLALNAVFIIYHVRAFQCLSVQGHVQLDI